MEEKKSVESDNPICCICMANKPDGVFIPCGHSGTCFACANKLLKETNSCHLCRKSVDIVLMIKETKNKDKVKVVKNVRNSQDIP